MNDTVILILSMAACLGGSILKKYYANVTHGRASGGFIFTALSSITAAAVLLCWGGIGQISTYTLLLGVAFGAITAIQGITNFAALQCGPMSYTTVIISFSTLISALSGVMFFGEDPLGWAQIVGIALMLGSFVLAVKNDGDEKSVNLKWFLLSLVAFVSTGGIGIMQKVHQNSEHKNELGAFLIVAFVISAVISAIFTVFVKHGEQKTDNMPDKGARLNWTAVSVMLICGAFVAVNNKFNLYLSGVMDSAVFFPVVNGGGLVLATVAALLVFKEKLTGKQWVGVVLGTASVIFLCAPF